MKKSALLVLLVLAAGMLHSGAARAQVFGQFGGASPLGVNARLFGAYAAFTESESELLGQLRLSFYPNVDFGFQGGLARVSVENRSRTSVKIGGDFKALVVRAGESLPADLSLGAAIGISSAEDFTVLGVGPSLVFSRTYGAGASKLTPYLGALLLFTRADIDEASNDTDVSLPLRFGAEYAPNQDLRVLLELQVAVSDQVNDDLRLALGVNFPF